MKGDTVAEKHKPFTQDMIGLVAHEATKLVDTFNKARFDCAHHAQNTQTKEHNCFEGNTKTECIHTLCPLKKA